MNPDLMKEIEQAVRQRASGGEIPLSLAHPDGNEEDT
jgi:hypothetical protein